jgi:hypothetical protein
MVVGREFWLLRFVGSVGLGDVWLLIGGDSSGSGVHRFIEIGSVGENPPVFAHHFPGRIRVDRG